MMSSFFFFFLEKNLSLGIHVSGEMRIFASIFGISTCICAQLMEVLYADRQVKVFFSLLLLLLYLTQIF